MIDLGEPGLSKLADDFRKWVSAQMKKDEVNNKITKPLYHYTSANGLLSVLKTGKFWLSSIHHMNDPSELAWGITKAVGELNRITSDLDRFERTFANVCLDALRTGRATTPFNYFVGCFSRRPDDLGQWRAYGDNGRGFALGIRPSFFRVRMDVPRLVTERVFVARMIYDEKVAIRRQRNAIFRALKIIDAANLNRKPDRLTGKFMQEITVQLMSLVIWNGLTAKHPAYANEDEVRLIVISPVGETKAAIQSRVSKSELIPYVEIPIDFKKRPYVASITAGPASGDLTEYATINMIDSLFRAGALKQKPIDIVNHINRSTIPYRG